MEEIWKKFDENALTHSSVHHLMAINDLRKAQGYARAIDIANFLNITRGSVSITLHKLLDKGYISEDKNKILSLSDEGKKVVNSVLSKRRVIKQFFRDVLGLSDERAEIDACKVEHLLSEKSGKMLMSFMGYFLSEEKEAMSFRQRLREFKLVCDAAENCDICELTCYYKEDIPHGSDSTN
jgi:DtxR family Mn-dependent transcriptional regulator